MKNIPGRPFYTKFAWAYDHTIAGPVATRCSFVQNVASQRGIPLGSSILDAGCGTGRYAIELAKRGYTVTGIDASAELVSVAQAKAEQASVPVAFHVGNIFELPSQPSYDGILCRGVLNDITDTQSRQDVFFVFARTLRQGGILLFDVREWNTSAFRKERMPVFEKIFKADGKTLTFRSVTQLDYEARQLLVAESHIVEESDGTKTVTEYNFVMQCWTKEEVHNNLIDAGFYSIAYFGAYDYNTPKASTDRIVAVASLQSKEQRRC